MKAQYDPEFIKILKKQNVRIRKNFRKAIEIFSKSPFDLRLNNHKLQREHKGYRSINITADCRALYREMKEGKDTIAYFVTLGTHKELYKSK